MLNGNEAFQWTQMYTTEEAMHLVRTKRERRMSAMWARADQEWRRGGQRAHDRQQDDGGDSLPSVLQSKASNPSKGPLCFAPPRHVGLKKDRFGLGKLGMHMLMLTFGLGTPNAYDNKLGMHIPRHDKGWNATDLTSAKMNRRRVNSSGDIRVTAIPSAMLSVSYEHSNSDTRVAKSIRSTIRRHSHMVELHPCVVSHYSCPMVLASRCRIRLKLIRC